MKTDKDLLKLIGAGSDTPPHVACRCFAADLRRVYDAGKEEAEELRQQLAEAQAEELRQQLAEARTTLAHAAQIKEMDDKLLSAAIAAVKLKDESLEAAHNGLRWWMDTFPLHVTEADNEEMLKLVKALTIQPDDAALKAWIGEPAGNKRLWALNGEVPAKERRENGRLAWPYKFKLLPVTEGKCLPDDVPLYSPKGLK